MLSNFISFYKKEKLRKVNFFSFFDMMTLSVFFKRTNDKKEKSHVSPLEYTRGAFCSVVNIMGKKH